MDTRKPRYHEIWRRVRCEPGGRGYYEISTFGNVRHTWKNGKVKMVSAYERRPRSYAHGSKYMCVKIRGKEMNVSRLVWETFCGKVPEGYYIIHQDGCKTNNRLENLRAVKQRLLGERFGHMAQRRRIERIDEHGEVTAVYGSSREAGEANAMSYQTVLDRCNHRRIKNEYALNGYTFRWADEEERKWKRYTT